MSRMPGAIWDPLAANYAAQPRMRAHDIVCIHTMVGSLEGTDSLFRHTNGAGYAGTESHFGTSYDGRIEQWQDTDFQAEANYNGSWHIISIENADYGTGFPKWNTNDGSQVPAFTDAQIEANAQICAWAHRVHGIPLELIPDSKPGRRGIAYHRQGVPGFMVAGGEQWSTSRGKVCPGDRRIAQIPQIIARAKQIVNGDDDMPYFSQWPLAEKHALADFIVNGVLRTQFPMRGGRTGTTSLEQEIAWLPSNLTAVAAAASGAADVEELRSVLLEAVQAGKSADAGATADEIVDALAARLAGPAA